MRYSIRLIAGSLFLLAIFFCVAETNSAQPTKNVLILLVGQPTPPATALYVGGIRDTFLTQQNFKVEIYVEHLNLQQFRYSDYEAELVNWLSTKYSRIKMDVIVTVMRDNYEFAKNWRDTIWPGTPVVFSVVDESTQKTFPPNFTGIHFPVDYIGTVQLAIQLQPDTRHLALVSGASRQDQFNHRYAMDQLKPLRNRFDMIEITGLSMDQIAQRLSKLPAKTIVLMVSRFIDGEGRLMLPDELYSKLTPLTNSPIFEPSREALGFGSVGGIITDYKEAGVETAKLVIQILNGESASSIAPRKNSTSLPTVDWKQLQRWDISESRLPPGSVVLNRPPSFWEEHRWTVIGTLSVIIVQMTLIALLLTERTRRRTAQEAKRKTAELGRSVLNSVQAKICILTREGIVLDMNDSWKLAKPNATPPFVTTRVGDHYRDACSRSVEQDEYTLRAIDGIDSVLRGERNHFSIEFPFPGKQRWIEMSVEPLKIEEGGVVIFHHDVTERRYREIEAQNHHRELAHVSRAAAMGELASSLAHELNQPLAAILSNVQAASRFLASNPPDLKEVQDALSDAAEDDVRAGEIIHRMRKLLKKEVTQFAPLEINEVVKSVIRLAANEALIRRVDLVTKLSESLPPIDGDFVQLQQVVLNILMNALDATSEQPDQRTVVIETIQLGTEVQLKIQDSGKGIPPEQLLHIFEPFYTTKRDGLGMGLSISRSIVQAHGGQLWAESFNHRGTMFYCVFPVKNGESSS